MNIVNLKIKNFANDVKDVMSQSDTWCQVLSYVLLVSRNHIPKLILDSKASKNKYFDYSFSIKSNFSVVKFSISRNTYTIVNTQFESYSQLVQVTDKFKNVKPSKSDYAYWLHSAFKDLLDFSPKVISSSDETLLPTYNELLCNSVIKQSNIIGIQNQYNDLITQCEYVINNQV